VRTETGRRHPGVAPMFASGETHTNARIVHHDEGGSQSVAAFRASASGKETRR
jgi:hypothetical protein